MLRRALVAAAVDPTKVQLKKSRLRTNYSQIHCDLMAYAIGARPWISGISDGPECMNFTLHVPSGLAAGAKRTSYDLRREAERALQTI